MHTLLRSPCDFCHLCLGCFMTAWVSTAQFSWYPLPHTLNLLSHAGSLGPQSSGLGRRSIPTQSVTLVSPLPSAASFLICTKGTKVQQQVLRSHMLGVGVGGWERALKATKYSPKGKSHHVLDHTVHLPRATRRPLPHHLVLTLGAYSCL